MRQKFPLLSQAFIGVSLALSCYVFIIFPFFMSSMFSLGYDNMGFMFPEYVYFSNSLRHGFGFPRWYPYEGGVPAGIAAMNLISLVPHRIIGYILTVFLPFKPIYTFKITILAGMALIAAGWWLFLFQLIRSTLSATVGTCALLLGGSGLFVLHAEQAIATMEFLPYILLALLKTRENFKYVLVLAILCGIALNVHYPFHALLTLIFIFIALLLTGRLNYLLSEKIIQKNIPTLLLAALFFILAITPSMYIALTKNDFSSPFRHVDKIEWDSYEDYFRMSSGGSNAIMGQLREYFHSSLLPRVKDFRPNDGAFTATMVHLILAGIGLFYFKDSLPVIIVVAFAVWASLGVNGSLPYYLFMMKFPFINLFRQWIFFVFMVNYGISIFVAMGYLITVDNLKKIGDKLSFTSKNTNAIIGLLTLFLLVAMVYGSKHNAKNYIKHFSAKNGKDPGEMIPRYSKNEFLEVFRFNVFGKPASLFQYKGWWKLHRECVEITSPQLAIKPPFMTRIIYNLNALSMDAYLKPFCESGAHHHSVIAGVPQEETGKVKMDLREVPADFIFDGSLSSDNYYLSPAEFQVNPKGISLKTQTQSESMMVLPYNYKLGLKVYVNEVRAETYPVYDGAMTGVFVQKGEVRLDAIMPFSFYEVAISIQAVLSVFVFVYVFMAISRLKNTFQNSHASLQ